MNQPTDGPVPAGDQAPGPDATQSIPSQPTQAMPQYSYPTPGQAPGQGPDAPAQPQTPMTAAAAAGVPLADDPAAGANGGGPRKGLLIGGLVAALVLGGGAVFAAQKLSGGGAQPADVLPGDSFAYARLDIDPSAGQKVAAVRFLGKIPQLKDTLGSDDMRKKLWESIAKEDDCAAKYDFTKDIEPWLGERVGVALRPGGTEDEPNAVAALQVNDEAKAKSTIEALADCAEDGDEVDVLTRDGYLLFTDKGKGDETLAAIGKGTLAQSATYSADMNELGEEGILSAWVDGAALVKEMSKAGADVGELPADLKFHGAAAVRFDPGYIELAGFMKTAGGPKTPEGNGSEVLNLPENTLGVFHLAGFDKILGDNWDTFKKSMDSASKSSGSSADDMIAQLEDELDVKLPDDLKVLLGSQFTLSVPDQEFGEDMPEVGLKIVTSDAAKADELVGKIEDLSGASGILTRKVEGDKLVLATTPDYADDLVAGGKLGDSEVFKAAVGDASKSSYIVFVDLDRIEGQYLDSVPDDARDAVRALRAFGLNMSTPGDGSSTFSMRLASN